MLAILLFLEISLGVEDLKRPERDTVWFVPDSGLDWENHVELFQNSHPPFCRTGKRNVCDIHYHKWEY